MKGALAVLLSIVLLVFVIGLWRSSLAAPVWEIVVTDENGKPLSGLTIREVWENYSFENEEHRADELTDRNGFARFPARQNTGSISNQIAGTLDSIRHIKTHLLFGRYAMVFVVGREAEELATSGKYLIVTNWTGAPAKVHTHFVVFASAPPPTAEPDR